MRTYMHACKCLFPSQTSINPTFFFAIGNQFRTNQSPIFQLTWWLISFTFFSNLMGANMRAIYVNVYYMAQQHL
jgi:hypothetical protein